MAAPVTSKLGKRRREDDKPPKFKTKKIRKQKHYSSSSSSADEGGFQPVGLASSDSEAERQSPQLESKDWSTQTPKTKSPASSARKSEAKLHTASDTSIDSGSTNDDPSHPLRKPTTTTTARSKRNDPTRFTTSMTAILSSKLSASKREDPVLARSTTAAEADAAIANAKLESLARQKVKQERKTALERGRVKDVLLGTDDPDVTTLVNSEFGAKKVEDGAGMNSGNDADVDGGNAGENGVGGRGEGRVKVMQEREKRLRKTAQRGVVKLFNAVRQAQVRAEEAAKETKGGSRGRREERVEEMSRTGFLEMVAAGGKGDVAKKMGEKGREIEEA